MLKARKKITHKEIKQDKLVTAYFESKDWFASPENKRKVSIGAIIVVAVIAGVFFWISSKNSKNEEAETKLSTVISLYESGKYQEAVNGDQSTNTMGLNDIVNSYGGTESGQTAKLYLGNCYYNLKDYDNALKNFDSYSGSSDIIKSACISGMGAVYESKGDLKKAAEYFDKAASVNKDLITNEENMYYAIRDYSQAGDKENARKIYNTLKDKFPKSKYIAESKRFEPDFKD